MLNLIKIFASVHEQNLTTRDAWDTEECNDQSASTSAYNADQACGSNCYITM